MNAPIPFPASDEMRRDLHRLNNPAIDIVLDKWLDVNSMAEIFREDERELNLNGERPDDEFTMQLWSYRSADRHIHGLVRRLWVKFVYQANS